MEISLKLGIDSNAGSEYNDFKDYDKIINEMRDYTVKTSDIVDRMYGMEKEAEDAILDGSDPAVESCAAIEHDSWARWMDHLFDKSKKNPDGTVTIPADKVKHWERQVETPYAELSEDEKESDRKEVRPYIEWLDKLRSVEKTAMDEGDKNDLLTGAGITGGIAGSTMIKKQFDKGNLSGREKLYHGTKKENVDSILEHGILGSKANDPKSYTRTAFESAGYDIDPQTTELNNKSYMARDKGVSNAVNQGRALRGFGDFNDQTIIKGKVPVWKMNTVKNPELMGAKTPHEFYQKAKNSFLISDETPLGKKLVKDTYDVYDKRTVTVAGDIPAQYLKGSNHYSGATAKEVGEFIKHNPKRFAGGVGKVLGGAALIGGGAYALGKAHKQSKTASIIDRMYGIEKSAGLSSKFKQFRTDLKGAGIPDAEKRYKRICKTIETMNANREELIRRDGRDGFKEMAEKVNLERTDADNALKGLKNRQSKAQAKTGKAILAGVGAGYAGVVGAAVHHENKKNKSNG